VAFDGQPRYVFPTRDCVILPIPNTTVEMLAQYLAGRVRSELAAVGSGSAVHLTAIEIEVEENFGQSASYRETLD
jgi:6-pyruvoyltetrahydropterin/6-carboxytetrahydropterin synthase